MKVFTWTHCVKLEWLMDCLLRVGNIASLVTQPHFKAKFGIDHLSEEDYADTKGWIVSITTAGAVFGCLGVCLAQCYLWSGAY